jgi:hypothetical protein
VEPAPLSLLLLLLLLLLPAIAPFHRYLFTPRAVARVGVCPLLLKLLLLLLLLLLVLVAVGFVGETWFWLLRPTIFTTE